MLFAFDLLELDGVDYRPLPLRERKLDRLVDRRLAGIAMVVFEQACKMGLKGIVSKRLTAPYRSGPSQDWLKIKDPDGPAMIRAREHFARLGQ